MIGKIYFERGMLVTVLARWGKGGGPRNVLISRHDGTKVVRPFRGLRRSGSRYNEATYGMSGHRDADVGERKSAIPAPVAPATRVPNLSR
jgi:hypothetical protein